MLLDITAKREDVPETQIPQLGQAEVSDVQPDEEMD
jgi:hypothetical protein